MVESDARELLSVFGDPKVAASFGIIPFNRAQMENWVRGNLEHQSRFGYGLFTILLKDTGAVIGDCGLERMSVEGSEIVELGYDLRSDFWNRGFATEAATAVRDYAFLDLGIPEVSSLVRVGNEASRRVARKLGMRLGRRLVHDGRRYWLYSIESNEQAR